MFEAYLDECRTLVLGEIRTLIPGEGAAEGPLLYRLMLDYPLRRAKALRPALAIATCRALGGRLDDVLRSAAVLELYHNAFLIHDDVEDDSILRRGAPTLHQDYGVPIAVNVGDGMLALALGPLLDNARLIGLGKALRVLSVVAKMARHSVEGQALELEWVRRGRFDLSPRDYLLMVYKKTCWYTFVAPVLVGATIAGAGARELTLLQRFATLTGVAFQIQDDVLNLAGDEGRVGKEHAGDLWEGKHTLIVMHAVRGANEADRARAQEILRTPRRDKRAEDVAWLDGLIARGGSLSYARAVAASYARRAEALLARAEALSPSAHRDFMAMLPRYVLDRDR
jgi:geranylgeranyl diphosphate synthase type II